MDEIKHIGRYHIVEVLGKGAMGVVYKGFDPAIERHVAIKIIRKELVDREQADEFVARFRNEAQAGGRLNHPGVVGVYEYGEDDEKAYIAMEYIHGRGLRDYFAKQERFGLQEAMSIMGQLLDALDYAHENGVVHRDIKPANIIMTGNGKLKIADFGIARLNTSNLTQVGSVMGTPSYMSPEQFEGLPVDRRTDIFSAGVILYELITGRRPFEGATETISYKICHEPHRNPSEINPGIVPATFDAVVAKALAKRKEDRFPTAREFASVLLEAYESRSKAPAALEATIMDELRTIVPAPERYETTTYPPSKWPVENLRAIEQLLAPYVGPMAKILVKNAAKSAMEGMQLVTRLADHIPEVDQRKAFTSAALARVAAFTVSDPAAVEAQAGANASRTGTLSQERVGAAEIEKATSRLAPYVGPIAKVIAKRAATKAIGARAFYLQLAASIPDPGDRARFLRESGQA